VTLLTNLRCEVIRRLRCRYAPTNLDQKERIMSEETTITMSVPAAGKKYFGLSRNGAYDAAARGDIPTIRIGRLLRVPVRALERMLERAGEPAA
jgi:hypothetical protein